MARSLRICCLRAGILLEKLARAAGPGTTLQRTTPTRALQSGVLARGSATKAGRGSMEAVARMSTLALESRGSGGTSSVVRGCQRDAQDGVIPVASQISWRPRLCQQKRPSPQRLPQSAKQLQSQSCRLHRQQPTIRLLQNGDSRRRQERQSRLPHCNLPACQWPVEMLRRPRKPAPSQMSAVAKQIPQARSALVKQMPQARLLCPRTPQKQALRLPLRRLPQSHSLTSMKPGMVWVGPS